MSEIIHEMAQIQLPQDLLQQVDLDDLLKKFKANHKKLSDFKNVRDKHEARGSFKKIWDLVTFDDTLEKAQLDAVDVQAEYSKAIGQLMVLSILQSQYLERQQQLLAEQQQIIKKQTTSIEFHNAALEKQHKDLARQNVELEKLVKDYFELKGLTQDGAKKLIAIAHEVKDTKVELEKTVENIVSDSLHQIGIIAEQIKSQTDDALKAVNSSISEIDERISALRTEAIEQLSIAKDLISSTQDEMKLVQSEAACQWNKFSETIESVESKHGELANTIGEYSNKAIQLDNKLGEQRAELVGIRAGLESEQAFSIGVDQKLNAIAKQFEQYQSNVNLKFGRLHLMLGASLILTIGLAGFILFRM